MDEIWKDIPGYEELYQVSNLGNIKSLSKIKLNNGKYPYLTKEKIIKERKDGAGYLGVALYKYGKRREFRIHQLVAITFLNHKPCGYNLVIDHINDNILDNRLENLQIITQRENAYKNQKNYSSKYKGVCYHKASKKWIASICINDKNKYLGLYKDEYSAHLAYQKELNKINI